MTKRPENTPKKEEIYHTAAADEEGQNQTKGNHGINRLV